MTRLFYRELWDARLRKMLELEEKSVDFYEDLLKESRSLFKDHSIVPHLEQLIADEKKHALLVRQLIRIAHKQVK